MSARDDRGRGRLGRPPPVRKRDVAQGGSSRDSWNKSFLRLLAIPKGFNPEGVLTLTLSPTHTNFAIGSPQRSLYFQEALVRVQALPGVQSAGLTGFLPLTESSVSPKQDRFIAGRPPFSPGQSPALEIELDAGGLPELGRGFRTLPHLFDACEKERELIKVISELNSSAGYIAPVLVDQSNDAIGNKIYTSYAYPINHVC